MNRTHWAVKDENLLERLQAASLIKQELIAPLEKHEDVDFFSEIKSRAAEVTSVHEFITKVLSEKSEGAFEVFYRGHSDKKKYKLVNKKRGQYP